MGVLKDVGGIVAPVAGAAMGLLMRDSNDRRQIKQQQKLTDMQAAANKQAAEYQNKLSMDMWRDTNFSAQKDEMEKAGLSIAGMYSGAGGGGTAGGASVAGVSGAQAANAATTKATDMQMGMQMAQLGLLGAQKANIEADTANKKAGAENTGVNTEQGKVNLETSKEVQKDVIDTIRWDAQKKMQEAGISFQENVVRSATQEATIKQIKTEAAIKMLEEGLTKEKITLTRAQINEISEKLAQGWKGLEYQGTDKITGKYIEKVADWIGNIGGK